MADMRTRVKMCCISSTAEIASAVRSGADVLGFVHDDLSGLGILPISAVASLLQRVPPGVGTWLLTGLTDPDVLSALHAQAPTDTIQLVNELTPQARAELKARRPGVRLVQVVHVTGEGALDRVRAAQDADALLLDSSDPASGALGATGKTHDWELSARIVRASGKPVWLAGGLRAGNVGEAVRTVAPWGVDLCTGIRTDGVLDEGKARDFVAATAS